MLLLYTIALAACVLLVIAEARRSRREEWAPMYRHLRGSLAGMDGTASGRSLRR